MAFVAERRPSIVALNLAGPKVEEEAQIEEEGHCHLEGIGAVGPLDGVGGAVVGKLGPKMDCS